MKSSGRTDGGYRRRLGFRTNDLYAVAIEPIRNGPRTGVPPHLNALGQRM
jgi:hypothetical protein